MNSKTLLSCLVGAMLLAGQASAADYTFISIDVRCPGAAASSASSDCPAGLTPGGQPATQTIVKGINARGDVVGLYVAGGKQHGFLLKDGEFSSLDFPVAGVRATNANGINARGEIVGQYLLPIKTKDDKGVDLPEDSPDYCPADLPSPPTPDPACIKGFHFWHGRFSTVMFPNTTDANGIEHKHPGAIAMHITSDGDIVGCVHDHDLTKSMFGAVWTQSGASSLTPSGGQLSASDAMAASGVPMSMNNGATPGNNQMIAGFYMDMSNQQHGYRVRNGMFSQYDPGGANLTAIWDANPSQQIVGTFRFSGEATAKRHAFLQSPDDSPAVTFDFTCQETSGCGGTPMGSVAFATIAFGVNPDGLIVGQYVPASGGTPHGFIAVPVNTN